MINNISLNEIEQSINSINCSPDKHEWKTTTSKVFKLNVLQFLSKFTKKNLIEMGAAQGHSTSFLSPICNKIYSIDIAEKNCNKINSLQLNNVTTVCYDLYKDDFIDKLNLKQFDIAIIDCIHDKEHINKDIDTVLKLNVKIIIFDDYGMFPEVKFAVDKFCKKVNCKKIFIGSPPNTFFKNTKNKICLDWEGVICILDEI